MTDNFVERLKELMEDLKVSGRGKDTEYRLHNSRLLGEWKYKTALR